MSFTCSQVQVEGDVINDIGRDQYIVARDHNVVNLNVDDPNATLHFLAQKVAANAFLDAEQRFPPPNCYAGTRTRIIGELSEWIEDGSKPNRVFWLYGGAGVGKSAIAQTLAEKYVRTRLAAAFFFSRNDSTRDNLALFVASIVYQFARSDQLWPVLGPKIVKAIRSNPRIFDTTVENQFQRLIIEPCSLMIGAERENTSNVIIIDGLDECLRSSVDPPTAPTHKTVQSRPPHQERPQERLLALIRNVATSHIPTPWIFLVFSRPEPQIRCAFAPFGTILTELAMTSSPEARRDIRKYFVNQFAKLRREHPALQDEDASWPGNNSINQLVDRADGQFVFAATVIKYIETCNVFLEMPQDRLDTIIRIYVDSDLDSPYSDLDLLYLEILSFCREKWVKVQPILCLLATPHYNSGNNTFGIHWRSPSMIALLLNLKKGEVVTLLSGLHSVLHIPRDDGFDIHVAHASFTEFLSDKTRSASYHTLPMSEQGYYDLMATFLLCHLSALSFHYPSAHPQCNSTATLSSWKGMLESGLTQYACLYWHAYCTGVETPSPNLLAVLNGFDPYCAAAVLIYHFGLQFDLPWHKVLDWARPIRESINIKDFLKVFDAGKDYWDSINCPANTILLLPADRSSQMGLPLLTRANDKVFRRISHALRNDEDGQALLLGDIQDDTCWTVLQNLVKEDDLVHFKQLLKERRELFFPECNNWSQTPSPAMQVVNELFSGDPGSFDPLGSTNLSPAAMMMKGHDVELPLLNPTCQQLTLLVPALRSRSLPLLHEDYGDLEMSTQSNKRKITLSDEDITHKHTRT
ncbi:nacht and wd40 domain-containing protein [Moniliophthora roreri]|nr:nacht and wd40 domain-containing protein [Moniliophthora roreri]